MKIYNIFTFFNEIELLKFRIDYLKNVVDYFVIVEADESFSGIPKKQNFSLDDFDPEVRSKIRYSYISYPNEIDFPVKITEKGNPNNRRAWAREWYSRSRLSDGTTTLVSSFIPELIHNNKYTSIMIQAAFLTLIPLNKFCVSC
jgi:hypothetical protein